MGPGRRSGFPGVEGLFAHRDVVAAPAPRRYAVSGSCRRGARNLDGIKTDGARATERVRRSPPGLNAIDARSNRAYRLPADHEVGQAYLDANLPILKRQLLRGGVRLATLLNGIFAHPKARQRSSSVWLQCPGVLGSVRSIAWQGWTAGWQSAARLPS